MAKNKAHYVSLNKQLSLIFGYSPTTALLGQIMFWFLASKNSGEPKTKLMWGGKRWVAKTKEAWAEETGISFHQCKRALVRLQEIGLIEVQRKRFYGQVMCHVWLNTLKLFELIDEKNGNLELPHDLITLADGDGLAYGWSYADEADAHDFHALNETF